MRDCFAIKQCEASLDISTPYILTISVLIIFRTDNLIFYLIFYLSSICIFIQNCLTLRPKKHLFERDTFYERHITGFLSPLFQSLFIMLDFKHLFLSDFCFGIAPRQEEKKNCLETQMFKFLCQWEISYWFQTLKHSSRRINQNHRQETIFRCLTRYAYF